MISLYYLCYDIADTLFGRKRNYRMFVYNQNPWNAELPVFRNADRFPSPNSTWTVQNSLDNQDACLATAFVKSCATFTIRWEIAALTSLSIHYHAHWKHDRSPWNMDTFILWTHSGGPNGVYFRGALLYIHV